jgi:predicted cupin superfamily sugar epimerase
MLAQQHHAANLRHRPGSSTQFPAMTRLLPLLVLALAAHAAEPALPAAPRAREVIAQLKMQFLEGESGYFSVIGRSQQAVSAGGRDLAAQSQIYYLLTAELPVNYLHWLASDDTHILLEGGPVDYFIFHPDGRAEKFTLGRDLAAGQRPVVSVPGNCWKALRLHPGATHALMANVLSPEWTPDRVKIGAGREFITKYLGRAPWATGAELRALIGPNGKD